MAFHAPNHLRVRKGPWGTQNEDGNNGLFLVPLVKERIAMKVIISDGEGWEHVSVSLPHRCPTWEEMCKVKSIFWDDDDCVMQLHPPKSDWVSNHQYCLHMWRPKDAAIPRPPSMMVGLQELGTLK